MITQRAILTLLITLLLVTGGVAAQTGEAAPFDLQAAIDAAPAGSVLDVPVGLYHAPLRIEKPLHLRGEISPDGQRPILDGGGVGTVLTVQASGTVVENFVIRNSGMVIDQEEGGVVVEDAHGVILRNNRLEEVLYGIRGVRSNQLTIQDNYVTGKDLGVARRGDGLRLWQSEEALIVGNTFEQVRDVVLWFSDNAVVKENRFHNSRYGIHMMYTDGMQVIGNYAWDNSVGAYLMYSSGVQIHGNTFTNNRGPSGYGLALKDMDGVTVYDNYFVGNRAGLFVDNSPSRVDLTHQVERNVLAFNDIGVLMMPSTRRNVLYQNTFLDNLQQVGVKGGGTNQGDQLGANTWQGNYWSDYVGYDASGDGVGEMAYRAESLFENLADRTPALALFQFSPTQQAIDFAAVAFPIIKPKPKLTDDAPLVEPFLPATPLQLPPVQDRMGWLALLLLGGSLGGWLLVSLRPPQPTRSLTRNDPPHPKTPAHKPEGPMLTVTQLTKRYPQPGRAWWSDATITAVDGVSFQLEPGESVALWGVNGAGKTTVLKCLLGLLACEGSLTLNGSDLRRDGRTARRYLGYVPQELAFHNDMSVAETGRFYARLKKVSEDRISAALAQVGLTGQEQKAVGALSGGMKQRLALALALLADPPVLLLDEPTSNLDAATRDEFIDLLLGLQAQGKTLLFTSHHKDEVSRLAQRVLVLQDGHLIAQGSPAAVGITAGDSPNPTMSQPIAVLQATSQRTRNGHAPVPSPQSPIPERNA